MADFEETQQDIARSVPITEEEKKSFPGSSDEKPKSNRETIYAKNNDREVQLSDFEIKKVIGRGSYGKVYVVQNKETKQVYAMKALKKHQIIEQKMLKASMLESTILT